MAVQEVTVDQRPVDLAPIDTSVVIPDHVKRAAALAESYYAKPEAARPKNACVKLPSPWRL